MLAIGGAFATQLLVVDLGYSRIQDVPTQSAPCVDRKECDGGQFACKATFEDNGILYVGIDMYKVPTTNPCTILLTHSEEN